ncbi:hypothetical protein [Corallococcus silvisoli]|uniref:hypothetical protein n=1 Tax=Corallococcus silvisoli TaxID=2697031 RepID=UPI0013784A5D|nr:hypothetical protein [Corallococcus silvisoli]NBD11514.1 hypothetical protein [Corallococcus silvisoli]
MHLATDALEALLLEALPPLHRRVRRASAEGLARRLVETCPRPAGLEGLAPWLGVALEALETELASVHTELVHFTRQYNEAVDDAARRQVLVDHLKATVKDRKDRREDLRALDRWMGFDALRERQEKRRHKLLIEEETALRALTGVLTRATARELQSAAVPLARQLLDRAVDAPREQNRFAALEAFRQLTQTVPGVAASLPEVGLTLTSLAGQEDASPFFQAEALRALLTVDVLTGMPLLRQRLRAKAPSEKDFLFRRQVLEQCAPLIPEEHRLPLLTEVAHHDPSEYVRMGLCALLALRPDGQLLLRRLAGLETVATAHASSEPSPRVRTAAVLAAVEAALAVPKVKSAALQVLVEVLGRDTAPLVLRVSCERAAALAEALGAAGLGPAHAALLDAVESLATQQDATGPVVEAASAAAQVLRRVKDPVRQAWTAFLAGRVSGLRPGSRTRIPLQPPPENLPPMPEGHAWLGAILADLSQDGHGLYAERTERTLTLWHGDRQQRRLWRMWHELGRPAPNKRQAFLHTSGRRMPGTLRAHPGHLDEITETRVPGERVHVASQGSWGRHLPTVDDLLDMPLSKDGKVHLFSSHGETVLVPPASRLRRMVNRFRVTKDYHRLATTRLDSLGGEEPRERRRFVEQVERELGVQVRFTPYGQGRQVPAPLATLFREPPESSARLHTPALLGLQSGFLALLTERIMENEGYFLGMGGNGIAALGLFTAALFSVFLGDTYVKRQNVREARARIPLCIGGWGTRGKSGTERLKAALFSGLGFEVFAKTTGSEAMFVHSAPGAGPSEFFIFRPYDKATIWEQKDMVELGARLGTEVFLWECMALQPNFVELLQNDWMQDDFATLTNAYPDHEDIQGPAGMDVASVITHFMPKGGRVVTTEDHFLPLFKQVAKEKDTTLLHSAWWEAELIPEELLALFPYREHPRNMALVATLAEQLGVSRPYALALMAEHVQPEIGVLKVFPPAKVRGRQLTFINGHSANERTGFMNNWTRTGLGDVDPEANPDRAVITVINNRWDRVSRSEVFARILVEDAPADRHVLIGTNLEGLRKYVRDALDRHLLGTEIVAAEELSSQEGEARAEARLAKELARLKVPRPTTATFMDRFMRYAAGADLRAIPTVALTAAVEKALEGADDEVGVEKVRRALEREVGPLLDAALEPVSRAQTKILPEVLTPATKDEVREHALYLLARMVVHARLMQALPRGDGDAEGRVKAFHAKFREAYRALMLEQLVPVADSQATGDQVVDACARAVAPGMHVSIMGAQNIKGTGLDWVYRWMALDRVTAALKALEGTSVEARRRALESLETFDDSGFVDAGLARTVLPGLVDRAASPDEADRLRKLAERARAKHEAKVAALTHTSAGGATQVVVRRLEKVFDYLDSVTRRRLSEMLLDDLEQGRVSHARAAVETRKLYERQKGGWLFRGLQKQPKRLAAMPTVRVPAPVVEETPIPTSAAQGVFTETVELSGLKVPVRPASSDTNALTKGEAAAQRRDESLPRKGPGVVGPDAAADDAGEPLS